MKRIRKKIIALVLVAVMLVSVLSGCENNNTRSMPVEETVTPSVQVDEPTPTISQIVDTGIQVLGHDAPLVISDNWEDYIGNLNVFVYGLIANDFGENFEVFPAAVYLPDGREVCGMAYTDYTECYADEDDRNGFVSAGFLSAIDDEVITQDEFDDGLIIDDLEVPEESFSFLMAYRSEPYKSHCVIYGQYLTYGVDEQGAIFYDYEPYQDGKCDESLGALYSYDAERYLFDPNVGEFVPITGESLTELIDFAEIEKEINEILETQDFNFAEVDTESCINIAKEAITSYILSLQVETFLGYDVNELVALVEQLDARECFRITDDGLLILEIEPDYKKASTLMKWVVGTGAIIAIGIVFLGGKLAKKFPEFPEISVACGAIAGVAIELFLQVVVEERDLFQGIDWRIVAWEAVNGAICGYIYTYLGKKKGLTFKVIDTLVDGAFGGVGNVIRNGISEGKWDNAKNDFYIGFVFACGISAGLKIVGALSGKLIGKYVAKHAKEVQKGNPSKLRKWINGLTKKVDDFFYRSDRVVNKRISSGQYKISSDQLTGNIFDNDGNIITKKDLREIAETVSNGTPVGWNLVEGEMRKLIVVNKSIVVDLSADAIDSVMISRIVGSRDKNFSEAAKEFLGKYRKNPDTIPKELLDYITNSGYDIEDLTEEQFVKLIQKSGWVFHECADMQTILLVSREVHEMFRHSGGVSVAKAMEIYVGSLEYRKLYGVVALSGIGS